MREIADETQVLVPAETLQEEVALLFEKYDLTTAGVVDTAGKLMGMITVDDVMEVAREEFEVTYFSRRGWGRKYGGRLIIRQAACMVVGESIHRCACFFGNQIV